MKQKKVISILVLLIVVVSALSAITGIFTSQGTGPYEYESIRGQIVTIYGKGLYHHMSAEVAIQGIAQDYVTLFIGVPLLLISLFFARKGSVRGCFLLAGTLGYFFVTYLFYLVMGMYNPLFLAYTLLMGSCFFALTLTILSFDYNKLPGFFGKKHQQSLLVGFLYLIFLSLLMTALTAKIIAMGIAGYNIIPAVFIIPTFTFIAAISSFLLLKNVKRENGNLK